jgi:hypothetical protein
MAEWGLTGQIRKEYFERVMELHSQREPSPGANYNQCIAITARAIGKMLEARISLQRTLALAVPGSVFSSWSYLTVSRERFLEEVKEMADLLDTDNFVPLFITRARGAKSQSATKDLFEL